MNIDWVSVSVILSVIAMIVGLAYFVRYALKHINEDKSEDWFLINLRKPADAGFFIGLYQ